MSQVIAFAGKGGTGKTTTAALFIHNLIKTGKSPVLAVDADPNSNLGEALGVEVPITIGKAREEFFGERANVPAGMPKEAYLQMKLNEALVEEKDFDLMVMGRQEGAGCYCYLNNILRHFIDQTTDSYPVSVIDNEAGMEHLARRTTKTIDSLIIVSDYSAKGLRAARRILELIGELDLTVVKRYLLVTRAPDPIDPAFSEAVEKLDAEFLGYVPDDEKVREFDIHEKSILDLPDDNPAAMAAGEMIKRIVQ
jgi:CO dehydrogenase maturation factor